MSEDKKKLALGKDSKLSPPDLKKINDLIGSGGLTPEEGHNLLRQKEAHFGEAHQRLVNNINAKKKEWLKDSENDKEVGGKNFKESSSLVDGVVDKFGGAEFKKFLDTTGLFYEPHIFKLFSRIGKALGLQKAAPTDKSKAAPPASRESKLYPSHAKGS